MRFIVALAAVILFSCSNVLEKDVQTIELLNMAGSGECSNWVTTYDYKRFNGTSDLLDDNLIVVESADPSQLLPDTLGYAGDVIKFSGQYYKNNGYPKTCKDRRFIEKGRIFRYTKYTVIESNYRKYLHQ